MTAKYKKRKAEILANGAKKPAGNYLAIILKSQEIDFVESWKRVKEVPTKI